MAFTFTLTEYNNKLFQNSQTALGFIDDWYDLGIKIGVQTRTLSYALKNRDALQKRIRLGDRIVYDSGTALKRVQSRLTSYLSSLYEYTKTDHLLGYIKGKDPRKIVTEECTGHNYLVHFDIKGYYDHIKMYHIVEMLKSYGFSNRGAKLIARYCVVKRTVGKNTYTTLQQGSSTSPIISNLVGDFLFDQDLLKWLDTNLSKIDGVTYKYLRYSDNVALFLDGEIPLELIQSYKDFVKSHLNTLGFRTHKWVTRPNNHPKQNQKFLGIVLNQIARIEKDKFNRLRATLFNACSRGITETAEQFFDSGEAELPTMLSSYGLAGVLKIEKFKQSMQGNIAYISSINKEHALQLRKLLEAAQIIDVKREIITERVNDELVLNYEVFNVIKTYKNNDQTLEHFIGALAVIITMAEEVYKTHQAKTKKKKEKSDQAIHNLNETRSTTTIGTTSSTTNWVTSQ